MSIRFRKSMKLLPGVRLNFSKETVGLSFGVPGARYTMNSKGRRTFSTGIPGTGLYNIDTLNSGTRSSRGRSLAAANSKETETWQAPPAPGLFARKPERELNKFLLDIYNSDHPDDASSVIEKATALKAKYEDLKYPLDLISFLHGATDEKWQDEAALWGAILWEQRDTAFSNKYVRKYFKGIKPGVSISTGITTHLHYNVQTLGFIWSEILQSQKV